MGPASSLLPKWQVMFSLEVNPNWAHQSAGLVVEAGCAGRVGAGWSCSREPEGMLTKVGHLWDSQCDPKLGRGPYCARIWRSQGVSFSPGHVCWARGWVQISSGTSRTRVRTLGASMFPGLLKGSSLDSFHRAISRLQWVSGGPESQCWSRKRSSQRAWELQGTLLTWKASEVHVLSCSEINQG